VIEPTDEMRRVVKSRMGIPDGVELDPWMEAAIGDVLALVERDRCMEARGHVIQTRCGAVGPNGITCQRDRHHAHHAAGDDQDRLVRW
jgi:hypothetical protein